MATHVRKAAAGKIKGEPRELGRELNAIDSAFKRVSKTPEATIRFLAKAGIVTKKGKLAKAYR